MRLVNFGNPEKGQSPSVVQPPGISLLRKRDYNDVRCCPWGATTHIGIHLVRRGHRDGGLDRHRVLEDVQYRATLIHHALQFLIALN